MLHLNYNLLCAIDVETTGNDPYIHELWQLAVLILGPDFKPHKSVMPFHVIIRPERPEVADRSIMRIKADAWERLVVHNVDHEMAREAFDKWLRRLRHSGIFALNRRLCPLSANWPSIDRPFLLAWLGADTFYELFSPWYRDTIPVAQYLNDVNYFNPNSLEPSRAPFPKCSQRFLGTHLTVPNDAPHNALPDAAQLAEIYRRLVLGGIDIVR